MLSFVSHKPSAIFQLTLWACMLAADGAALAATRLDPTMLAKYVDPLPNPLANLFAPVGTLDGLPLYEVSISQFEQKLHRDLPATTVWGYNNAYPGPTFVVDRGEEIKIRWVNNLVDSAGAPLTQHLLPYDTTLHGSHDHMPRARVITHVHGNITDELSDGYPEHWFTPDPLAPANGLGGPSGNSLVTNHYNDQRAATLWYHDHAMGITRLNVYAGMAGFYLVRDAEEAGLNLPSGKYEIPLVLQDRSFYADGQLIYPAGPGDLTGAGHGASGALVTGTSSHEHGHGGHGDHGGPGDPMRSPALDGLPDHFPSAASQVPHFFGDVNLVNGVVWPYLEVEPRKYRLRMLNGANSRFYDLVLDHGDATIPLFHQIGTDGGLLTSPVNKNSLLLGPADRADVIVDFSQFNTGDEIFLRNVGPDADYQFINSPADAATTGQVMKFKVVDLTAPDDSSLPTQLSTIERYDPADAVRTRTLRLTRALDEYGRFEFLLDGKKWTDPITEEVQIGDLEIWEFDNRTPMAHPMHLHMDHFQVLERIRRSGNVQIPLTPDEMGWEDTVVVGAGEIVRIMVRFDQFAGTFVWHCHVLEHEDLEMMRPFTIIARPIPEPAGWMLAAIGALGLASRRRRRERA